MKRFSIMAGLIALLVIGFALISAADDSGDNATSVKADSGKAPAPGDSAALADSSQSAESRQVVVYYFHGTRRCPSCLKIEAYTHQVIDSLFAEALGDSLLAWRVINTDEEPNQHYRDDYQLYSQTVIVSDLRGGKEARWKNLEKVWELLGNEAAFKKYIHDEVHAYLTAK